MSFKTREKKRQGQRAHAAVNRSRRTLSAVTAGRWFLTLALKDGACAVCGLVCRKGSEIVYRHKPIEIRCVRCGGRLEDSKGFRPSIRWERAKRVPRAAA